MIRLIVNPSARSGRSRARAALWQAELTRRGTPFAVSETQGAGHAAALARDAAEQTVVAVGGDGTINEVLNGVLQSPCPKTMGVLYAGTSPDFCRFNRIPFSDPRAALDVLLRAQTRPTDVARLACGNESPCFFACGCNIGMGSRVAAFANANRRYFGDAPGTALGLLLAIREHRRFTARLDVDGAAFVLEEASHIFILKNPFIASGLRLDVPRTPDDGQLTVLALHHLSRAALLRMLPSFYSGQAVRHPSVFRRDCRSVSLVTDPAQAVEFDGDPRGETPVSVELLPRALTLICEASHA